MEDITPARKLFDLLVSRDFDPEMLDSSGKPAPDPAEAEIFSFDFRAQSGKDYGTVVIMLSDEGDLDVYCADNVGKTMEEPDKTEWFQFLEQLKNFAVRNNRMNFGVKNLNHLRYSMQGQAAIKEGLFESWAGKKDVSWNAGATESRLMIKHKRSLGEDEARFRYVESLFIETAEGERYKLPFKNLTAGKAMLEHVRNGGRPYDMRGQHISEMVSELTVLSRFRRANHGKLLEGDTAELVEQTNAYYENLQRNLKSLTSRRGYDTYFESWSPAEVSEESMVIEGLKHLFVTQSIDQRIEDALPLIARIQQQENAMKEANIFEAWANKLMEGTWQLPDTPEKQARLIELMSQDLPVGADATNATEQLYDLIGDDHLFDQLEALADRDANADARQVIYDRLSELSEHPEVRQVIDNLNIDADAAMNPPEATNPADLEAPEEVDEVKEPTYQDDLAGILKIAGVPAQERPAPDYEEEVTDEGWKAGALGAGLGALAGGPLGAVIGGGLGGAIEEDDKDKKDSGSILPAVAAGVAGAGLGYMAGKAASSSSTKAPTSSSSSLAGDDKYGSWENPDQISPPTATGSGLGINPPAAGSSADIAASAILEKDEESDELNRMSDLAGIKKKVADESLLAPLVGAVGGAALGGELASGIGSKFGSEVGGSIGQAAGQEQAGKLGALVGGMKGSSAGAAAGGTAAKKFGQIAGGIAGLAGGAAIDQAKKSNDDEKTNEGSDKKSSGSVLPVVAAGAAGAGLGYMASKMGKPPTTPPTPAEIASGTNPMGDIAGSIFEKDNEETDEGWKGQLAGGVAGSVAGELAGAPLGPLGVMAGGALGGIGGGMLGDKLGDAIPDDKDETDEGVLGTLAGGALGTVAGAAVGAPYIGAGLGAYAGQKATQGGSSLVEKDNEETNEGVRGALAGGAVGGYATRSVKGAVAGAKLGSAIQDRFSKKDDASPLEGQYGHSGKMQEVGKDTSFLDRLKELSGLKR